MPVDIGELTEFVHEATTFRESYNAMARSIASIDGDPAWNLINTAFGDGQNFTLDELKEIVEKTREMALANPILKRAISIRSSNVFGKVFTIKGAIPERINRIVENVVNEQCIGSVAAWMRNERTAFTDGSVFFVYNKTTKEWSRLLLNSITNWITDPIDPERVRYYQRTYTDLNNLNNPNAVPKQIVEWIAVDSYTPPAGLSRIQDKPLNRNLVIVDVKFNADSGQTLGVPDALPALPWASLYREYLKDGAKVIKALASIAWVLKNKTQAGVQKAAARVPVGGIAATANMTDNMDLSAMPRSNQVDLNTGRALAAMVATACEVSVVSLLSDPGVSGAAATAKTLDPPTEQAAQARQEVWAAVIKRIYRVMGYKGEFEILWPNISEDPEYRKAQSLSQFWSSGNLHPDEYRNAMAEELNVRLLREKGPDALTPNTATTLEKQSKITAKFAAPKVDTNTGDIATGQGKSGAGVGDLSNGDNSARDEANERA